MIFLRVPNIEIIWISDIFGERKDSLFKLDLFHDFFWVLKAAVFELEELTVEFKKKIGDWKITREFN